MCAGERFSDVTAKAAEKGQNAEKQTKRNTNVEQNTVDSHTDFETLKLRTVRIKRHCWLWFN